MTILTVCEFGMNRSRRLAEYLSSIGYNAIYGGVREPRDVLQQKIDQADVVVSIHPKIADKLMSFNLGEKKLIGLDVPDVYEQPGWNAASTQDWMQARETSVYPKLIEQMEKYLPLK